MEDLSLKSLPMTCANTQAATSLQVSEDGALPCDLQDGLKTDQSGREAALASPSVQQESKKVKWTSDIYGQYGSASFSSLRLQESMENKLLQLFSHGWLDGVYSDMEAEGYAIGSSVLPACGVNAPHRRDRLWFVADRPSEGLEGSAGEIVQERGEGSPRSGTSGELGNPEHDGSYGCEVGGSDEETVFYGTGRTHGTSEFEGTGSSATLSLGVVANVKGVRGDKRHKKPRWGIEGSGNTQQRISVEPCGSLVDNRIITRSQGQCGDGSPAGGRQEQGRPVATSGFWDDADWIVCGDGKARRIPSVESEIRLLGYGVPARVATLYGFGNAIVPTVAERFIRATM